MGGSWIVVVCFLGFWTCFWRYQFWGWFWEKFPAVTQLFLILRGESKSRYQGFNFKKKHYFFTYRNRISTDVSLPLWKIHNKDEGYEGWFQLSPSFILGPEMNAWHSKKMIPKRPWRPWSDGRDMPCGWWSFGSPELQGFLSWKKQHVSNEYGILGNQFFWGSLGREERRPYICQNHVEKLQV